ncbi:MAG: His/Gly/Thr/Pro-type tRNA ligase C-terminal domain-containing protein, partial [Candidatus Saccharimonadales bacterium]
LMGIIAELFADERGLAWPEAVAPAKVCLVRLGDAPDVVKIADEMYNHLTKNNVGVIYDDRDKRAGEKLVDSELLGLPQRIVVSDKTASSGEHEFKLRKQKSAERLKTAALYAKIISS